MVSMGEVIRERSICSEMFVLFQLKELGKSRAAEPSLSLKDTTFILVTRITLLLDQVKYTDNLVFLLTVIFKPPVLLC